MCTLLVLTFLLCSQHNFEQELLFTELLLMLFPKHHEDADAGLCHAEEKGVPSRGARRREGPTLFSG